MTYEECIQQLNFHENQSRHWRQLYENSSDIDGDGNPIDPAEQVHLDTIDNMINTFRRWLSERHSENGVGGECIDPSQPPATAVRQGPTGDAMEAAENGDAVQTDATQTQAAPRNSVLESVSGAASDAWNAAQESMREGSERVQQAEHSAVDGIDRLQDTEAQLVQNAANLADGIPVVEHVADAAAFAFDQSTQLGAGALQGAASMVAGFAAMSVNPIDTASGIQEMMSHVPGPIRDAGALYDVLVEGKDASEALDPVRQLEEDVEFGQNLGRALIEPYERSIGDDGEYMQAVGRAGFDIASLFVGGEGALGDDVSRAGRVANRARSLADDAVHARGLIDDAARGRSVADEATRATRVADDAGRTAGVTDDVTPAGGSGASPPTQGGSGSTPPRRGSPPTGRPEVGPGSSHPTRTGREGPTAAELASAEGIRARKLLARERIIGEEYDPLRDLLYPDEIERFKVNGQLPDDVRWHHTTQTSSDFSMADEVESIEPVRHREHIFDEHGGDTGATPTAGIRGDVTTPERPIYDPNAPEVQTRRYDPMSPGADDLPLGDQGLQECTVDRPMPDVDAQLRRDYPELFNE